MDFDFSKMVFVTGFARGGTTWLRNSIASHPDIGKIPGELVLFRDHAGDREAMARLLREATRDLDPAKTLYVEKSPANAPCIDRAVKVLPEAKFLFVVRDPRDVFISHKRGTKAWMGGRNKKISGCLAKTRLYYEGYERAWGAPNLLLVRYEDLHQDFMSTLAQVWEFLGVEVTREILERAYEENDFWNVATRHIEQRDSPRRKGVVGDWVNFLEEGEAAWLKADPYWREFMGRFGYDWEPLTYLRMLRAMAAAGVAALDEEALHAAAVDPGRLNVVLCHDVDSLRAPHSRESILALAEEEARLGFPALYFFLPLDDARYGRVPPEEIAALVAELRRRNPRVAVGLHLNAAERFFPAEMDDAGDDHPDMARAVAYLHEQIDAYAARGITFRTATAHGYGRRRKRPNNRDSPLFTAELKKRGILMWDTVLRRRIFAAASHVAHLADVGGAVAARDMPSSGSLTDAETYLAFPPGSLIHFLTHPGNYDAREPITLGRRTNVALRAAGAVE